MTYNVAMLAGDVLDSVLNVADQTLRTLFAPARSSRTPTFPRYRLDDPGERRHSAGLMRVNHAGEIAAQGSTGTGALSRSSQTREFLDRAANEEADHLAWCEARLHELGSRPSLLNPLWYLGSFGLGPPPQCSATP